MLAPGSGWGVASQWATNDAALYAVCDGHEETVRMLLEYGADPCVGDDVLLKNAVHARQDEMVRVLLARAGPHAW